MLSDFFMGIEGKNSFLTPVLHVVLFKLKCLEVVWIPSRFIVRDAEWHDSGRLLRESK